MDAGTVWITQYGYGAIFVLLMLGIVGLPVPDETLLTFAGYLVFKQKLAFLPTLATAFLGSSCGVTVSYACGRGLGLHLMRKVGPLLRLKPEHLSQVQTWFARWGKYTLIIGYFVPGIRHFTAFVAGSSRLPLSVFALFAYSGALVWTSSFIGLGYLFGEEWTRLSVTVHRLLIILVALVSLPVVVYFLLIRRRQMAASMREAVKKLPQ
jgi:membrane protein DedA with SNARE-associated domain